MNLLLLIIGALLGFWFLPQVLMLLGRTLCLALLVMLIVYYPLSVLLGDGPDVRWGMGWSWRQVKTARPMDAKPDELNRDPMHIEDDYPYITADSVLKSLPPDVRIALQCPCAPCGAHVWTGQGRWHRCAACDVRQDGQVGSTIRTSFHPGGVVLNDFAD